MFKNIHSLTTSPLTHCHQPGPSDRLPSLTTLTAFHCSHCLHSCPIRHIYSVKRKSKSRHSPAHSPFTAPQHMKNQSWCLTHDPEGPWSTRPPAPHQAAPLSALFAPTTRPLPFSSLSSTLWPEGPCACSFLTLPSSQMATGSCTHSSQVSEATQPPYLKWHCFNACHFLFPYTARISS